MSTKIQKAHDHGEQLISLLPPKLYTSYILKYIGFLHASEASIGQIIYFFLAVFTRMLTPHDTNSIYKCCCSLKMSNHDHLGRKHNKSVKILKNHLAQNINSASHMLIFGWHDKMNYCKYLIKKKGMQGILCIRSTILK